MKFQTKSKVASGIPTASLPDIVFMLLIFFMVTTVFKQSEGLTIILPDAKKIENITWTDFRALIPTEWDPGLSTPFDPIAAKVADEKGIEVAIINGARPDALKNYLHNEEFIGTKIS